MLKETFTTFDVAKLCNVAPLTVVNWIDGGRLPAFRTPGGHRRVQKVDLLGFMRRNGFSIPESLQEGSGLARLLVVDDDANIRSVIAEHFSSRSRPYEVATAANGFEAGRLMVSFRPDIVLLDLHMPGMDGIQVCRRIKADPRSVGVIVIAITGYYTPEMNARVLECGAVRCFPKPVAPFVLSGFIDSIVSPSERSRRQDRRLSGSA
jgi:excisionase family DNA binding protein